MGMRNEGLRDIVCPVQLLDCLPCPVIDSQAYRLDMDCLPCPVIDSQAYKLRYGLHALFFR